MNAKLRIRTLLVASVIALSLSACSADPLSPKAADNLRQVHADMDEARAYGIVQNLRLANLYQGATDTIWDDKLAEAINQAHFDLDFIDEQYDLETRAGAAAFLRDLSSVDIRPRLLSEVDEGPGTFELIVAPKAEVVREGRRCAVDGGSYSRNGEMVYLTFYTIGGQAGYQIVWDGWPTSVFPRFLGTRFGEQTLPMMVEYEHSTPVIQATAFNTNGSWVIDGMKRANEIEIGESGEIAPMVLPTGDLYDTAMALEACGNG